MGNKLHLAAIAALVMVASFTCLAKQSAGSPQELLARKKPAWVVCTGVVKTGIVAVGAETTGIILTTKTQGTVELDCGNSSRLLRQAEQLDGEEAVVAGIYREFPGVEVEMRRVIRVQVIIPKK